MGVRRTTSYDVAKRAGVSRTTVSLVLNNVPGTQISEETRQRVLAVARELGYVPDAAAQALASRRVHLIGLIFTRSPHRIGSDVFLTLILENLLDVIHQYNLRLLFDVVEPEHQKETYLQLVRSKKIDGILLSGPRVDDQALRALEEDGFPAVLLGQLPGTSFCSVDIDNCAAARKAVAHLLHLGHSRVACITNAPLSYTAASDRLLGYRHVLEEAGIPYDESLVRTGDFSAESGYTQMKSLIRSKVPFSAAFVASDLVAMGAKAALTEAGRRVPEDVALVGFDDLPLARFTNPPLTTVHLPVKDIARRAAEMLIQILNGQPAACRQAILDTHLVVRKSCGAG